jgi:SAM-dependent methyltransferase
MTNYELAGKWSSIEDIISAHTRDGLRLDLGCGYVKPPGFVGLDNLIGARTQVQDDQNGPDILIDLNVEPLPFPSDSCDEVRASHFIEHSVLDHIFDETFRVLKPTGRFLLVVPYANSAEGMYPGHHVFLTENFFHANPNFQSKFEIERETYDPTDEYTQLPWIVRKLFPFERARLFLFNACWQMTIDARPRK